MPGVLQTEVASNPPLFVHPRVPNLFGPFIPKENLQYVNGRPTTNGPFLEINLPRKIDAVKIAIQVGLMHQALRLCLWSIIFFSLRKTFNKHLEAVLCPLAVSIG